MKKFFTGTCTLTALLLSGCVSSTYPLSDKEAAMAFVQSYAVRECVNRGWLKSSPSVAYYSASIDRTLQRASQSQANFGPHYIKEVSKREPLSRAHCRQHALAADQAMLRQQQKERDSQEATRIAREFEKSMDDGFGDSRYTMCTPMPSAGIFCNSF